MSADKWAEWIWLHMHAWLLFFNIRWGGFTNGYIYIHFPICNINQKYICIILYFYHDSCCLPAVVTKMRIVAWNIYKYFNLYNSSMSLVNGSRVEIFLQNLPPHFHYEKQWYRSVHSRKRLFHSLWYALFRLNIFWTVEQAGFRFRFILSLS